jgi:hypothetical protein
MGSPYILGYYWGILSENWQKMPEFEPYFGPAPQPI